MNWDNDLEGNALQIAASDARNIRVPAGPGTGKSFALQRRVGRLLQQGQDPKRILVVTFTRNAASSLVKDLHDLDVDGCENVRVGTLHSYCFSLLHRENIFEYLARVPRPLFTFSKSGSLQFEGNPMLADLQYYLRGSTKPELTEQIKAFVAAWSTTQEMHPGYPTTVNDRVLQDHLLDWLKFHRSILIGELIPLTLRFLIDNPVDPNDSPFDHVIVDEYQDLNRAEQDIIDILAQRASLTVVGDPDQSIFSFRHAHPDGMNEFPQRHPDTHDITLNECRRCPTNVVHIANALISNNHSQDHAPAILPFIEKCAGNINLIKWRSIEEEIEGISGYVKHLIQDNNVEPKDILIISPRREIGYPLRAHLESLQIETESHFNEEPIDDDAAQRIMAILTLLCDKQDRSALRYWLGRQSDHHRAAAYHNLRTKCSREHVSPFDVLYDTIQNNPVFCDFNELVEPFKELLCELRQVEGKSLPELVEHFISSEADHLSFLREIAIETLEEASDMETFFERLKSKIAYPERGQGNKIRIMSPLKSKGLTSKFVVVTTCIEGILPFRKPNAEEAEREDILKEQRRLFYVAITRCSKSLVISSIDFINRNFAQRNRINLPNNERWILPAVASKFIGELGPRAPMTLRGTDWAERGYQ